MSKIDIAKEKFEEFKCKYVEFKDNDISESDTRSKILDYILVEVLDWNEINIRREGHSEAGFFDYKISIPGFNFVTEAKKNYEHFKLPIKHKYVTLGTLYKENSQVIKQIRNYLVEEGTLYGVITNGHQFIISKFINTDGSQWKSNKAVIFKSIDDIESRFIEFYNLLSFDSVIENSGFKIDEEISFEGKTIYSTISYPNKELIRNSLSANLTPLLDSIFGEIFHNDFSNDEELVKECFVSNKEVKKNRTEIERLFADLPPKLEEVIPVVNTENIISQIEGELSKDVISIKETKPPKPIIIVGSKGAGKTTFINYLFNTSFSEEKRKTHPVVYLDIRKYTSKDLKEESTKIYSEILEKLFDRYEDLKLHLRKTLIRIYIKEIKRNDEGIWFELKRNSQEYESKLSEFLSDNLRNVEYHFIKLSHYLIRERRMRLCVIFDNADQLDIKTQQEAFLFSQSINSKANCGVILSLREGYYYKWRNKPPFDAYYSHVYHITAPPYGDIIQKRIDYALKEVQKEGKVRGNAGLFGGTGADIEVSIQAIIDFLNSAKNTLFSTKNSAMLNFLSQTTYPNIREGLRLFKRFLISGHTQVDQYVIRQSANPNSKIPIPIHEFVKAIALDNKLVYNSESSVVHNLFKPVVGSTNHFLKYKILKYLSNFSKASTGGEKFVLVEKLIDVFGHSGYRRGVLMKEFSELLRNGLVESQEIATDTDYQQNLNITDSLTLTFKGYYYVEELVNRFHYLELVAQDTPIFDKGHFNKMSEGFIETDERGYKRLDKRIEFVKAFYEYLCFAESKETLEGESIIKGVMNKIKNSGLNRDVKIITEIIKTDSKR